MGAGEIARFLPGLVRRETSEEEVVVAAEAVEDVEEIEVSGTRTGEPTGEKTAGIEVSSPGSV